VRRLFAGIIAICLSLVGSQIVAHAEFGGDDRGTVSVPSAASGGVVSQGNAGYDPSGTQATASSRGSQPGAVAPGQASGSDYTYRQIPYNQVAVPPPLVVSNNGTIMVQPVGTQNACPPGQTGYFVYGPGGGSAGTVCAGQAPPPNTPEAQLAQEASSKQPWPHLVIGINPGTGLTGLGSWFWLGGGSTAMPDATATSGPLTVSVHAAFAGATWDFGDGSRYDSSDLGQPYPAASDVQHVYQTDSYGLAQGYTVSGILRFLVTYSVNGGPWQQLGVKSTAFTRSYPVFQLQPEAVSGQ